MKYIKDGVLCKGLQTEFLDAMFIMAWVYYDTGEEFKITSLNDGDHMPTSFHYKGLACDLRTWNLKHHIPQQMADLLKAALGDDYDVVVEKDHLHIERDVGP